MATATATGTATTTPGRVTSAMQANTWSAFAAQLLFVLGAAIVAGTSEKAASAMLAVMVALALLWAIGHYGG